MNRWRPKVRRIAELEARCERLEAMAEDVTHDLDEATDTMIRVIVLGDDLMDRNDRLIGMVQDATAAESIIAGPRGGGTCTPSPDLPPATPAAPGFGRGGQGEPAP